MTSTIPAPHFFGIFTPNPMSPQYDGAKAEGYDVRDVKDLVTDPRHYQITAARSVYLRPGDVVHRTFYNRYQHGFTVLVEKVNAKSIVGTEIKGSYGAGCQWRISFPTEFIDPNYKLGFEHMSTERLNEIVTQWIHDGV